MRQLLIALPLLLLQVPAAQAQVAVNIGINFPAYPQMVLVPDYPVYYAPEAPGNYFFYDGFYWVFEDDVWYYSSWYNGPWYAVAPEYVPAELLRVPVRYYRRPPVYFSYWRVDSAPRWGDHWGPGWSQRRYGWDQWDRRQMPRPAPLPEYQRRFPQSRYPQPGQQDLIRDDNYRYQPRNPAVRGQFPLPPPGPRSDVPGRGQAEPQMPSPFGRQTPVAPEGGQPGRRVNPNELERGVRTPERIEPPAARMQRPESRDFEGGAPGQRGVMPNTMERGSMRQPEQRAAPVPQMQPQMPPPQMPQPQPQQQQPRAAPPPQAPGPGSDRMPGQRRLEDGLRGVR